VDARMTKSFTDGWRSPPGRGGETAFLIAAKGGDTQMMRLLAANGADVKATNSSGANAFMLAAGVSMFNPNEDSGTDADGLAAMKVARELGCCDINATNTAGETALHGAIHRTSLDIIQYLADNGAKLDAKNKRGMTPIQLAVNGVGVGGGLRPETEALLRKLMEAQGLDASVTVNTARYNFGVKIAGEPDQAAPKPDFPANDDVVNSEPPADAGTGRRQPTPAR
jgi:hypothetical protein